MAQSTLLKTLLRVLAVLIGLAATGAAVFWTARFAKGHRSAPARCAASLVEAGPRCCAPGQGLDGRHCVGSPVACPRGMAPSKEAVGCVVAPFRIDVAGGALTLSAEDWQAEGVAQPRAETIAPFALDNAEVTVEQWTHCQRAGSCPSVDATEPGLPVTGIDAKTAERFCRFAGGRLPTSAEWLLAAVGREGHRFPWGPTGLVCRRAAFGLVKGPCASGGGPELAGARPDGASPEGFADLSGNVAEWTVEPDGRFVARGGSYRSESAAELTSWASETPTTGAPWIGFRCAYDRAPPAPALPR